MGTKPLSSKEDSKLQGATVLGPGDFPLGSAQSRAAARLRLRSEHVNLNELFDRMTHDELETYAKDGTLPAWFEHTVGATGFDSRGGPNGH